MQLHSNSATQNTPFCKGSTHQGDINIFDATQNTPFCKGSTHQGDINIFDSHSVGCQCLPNSLMACVMSVIEEPSNWTTKTMDDILHEGDKLYQMIDTEEQLLLPSDLPVCVTMYNRVCHIITGKEAYGSFVRDITNTKVILSALCTLIQRTNTSALLCLGDKTGSSAIALLSTGTHLFVFDSHSRDNSGMPCANGTAILMKFHNIDSTTSYICDLAHGLSAKLFHWTFWHAQIDVQCDCKTTSTITTVRPVGMLLNDEILQLHSESTPTVPKQCERRKYYASYRKKIRQSETVEGKTERRLNDKIHKQVKRANETVEETANRRLSDKIHKHARRTKESSEQSLHSTHVNNIQPSKTSLPNKIKCETITDAMNNFNAQCKKQPVYVCTSCHRLLWRKGVQNFNVDNYANIDCEVKNFVLAEKYRISSKDRFIYICHTCHNKLHSGSVPAQDQYLLKVKQTTWS